MFRAIVLKNVALFLVQWGPGSTRLSFGVGVCGPQDRSLQEIRTKYETSTLGTENLAKFGPLRTDFHSNLSLTLKNSIWQEMAFWKLNMLQTSERPAIPRVPHSRTIVQVSVPSPGACGSPSCLCLDRIK